MTISPIDAELLRNAMSSIVDEMFISLMKSSYSTNIKERKDHSTALFDIMNLISSFSASILISGVE